MALILKGRSKLKGSTVIGRRPYAIDGVFNPELVADFPKEYYRKSSAATTFSGLITHTRASTATYVDSNGLLQTAAINEPRVGHHVWNGSAWVNEGLLHESEARTNLVLNSQDFTLWLDTTGNLTQTASVDTSPDGGTNAYVVEDTGSGDDNIYLPMSVPADTTTYTYSLFVKKTVGDAHYMNIAVAFFGGTVAYGQGTFNTNLGVFSATQGNFIAGSALVQDSGDWWRISISSANNGTGTSLHARIFPAFNTDGTVTRNNATTGAKTVFGAQVEAAPTPSSYIPTNSGSAVTRAADVLTIPAANLPWPSPVVIGPELVTNGTFDTDSDWTLDAGVTISGGTLNNTTDTSVFAQQIASGLIAGRVYKVTYDVTTVTSGSVSVSLGGNASLARSAIGSYEDYLVAGNSLIGITSRFGSAFVGSFDNISVREINPLAVSIQMDGRVTYADENAINTASFFDWRLDTNNRLQIRLDTDAGTGQVEFVQFAGGVFDGVISDGSVISPDVFEPFNIASRHGSTFINGAVDGTALTANTTPTALADLSASSMTLANKYNGTIRTFRIWAQDIGDAGLVEATEPSLVPSLSLTFDGTENSFIVEDWSE